MSQALAVKYRPSEFEDVSSQTSIIKILKRQLELKQFKNVYLFCGPSGCGKTTLARIFANKINNNHGHPIELDAASNNGVDQVRDIINSANERSLDSEYKIYIVDECHAITTQGWQAFLKCIEEPPMYTIFIFCTTDPQKLPATILNRVQRFNLTKINLGEIRNRLQYVCNQEHYINFEQSIDLISKLADGGMRDALALLDKCSGYSSDLNINNTLEALGNYSYETMLDLTKAITSNREDIIINIVDDLYNNGNDLKLFIDQYLKFIFDVKKYVTFKNINVLTIPANYENELISITTFENSDKYYTWLVDKIFSIKNLILRDTNVRLTIEIMLIQAARGV